MAKDYYEILGVQKNATSEQIKKAFREKAHLYHPDKKGGDEAKFKEANEAYQVLGDAQKRQQYDQFGSAFNQGGFGGGGAGGFNWQDFARQQGGYSSGSSDFEGFGDIFGDLGEMFGFGGSSRGRKRGGKRSGADIETEMTISFLESVFGVEKLVDLYKTVVCQNCNGNGAEPGSKVNDCLACGGTGQVQRVQNTILGAMRTVGICSECRGEGKKVETLCKKCGGSGTIKDREQIKIKVPAGISSGQSIKLSGKGEAGQKGASAGDLYINIRVTPDSRFERSGDNILTKVNLSFKQAALGDKVEIQTVDGPVVLKIPDGTQSGKVFSLKGKGVPHLNRSGRGDHLVEAIVLTPTRLSRVQKKALEELE
ncbi:MAG: molecular chaperone DnaJ [Patescibacteria group bacterium]